MKEKKCLNCKKVFLVKESHYDIRKNCSKMCSAKQKEKDASLLKCVICKKNKLKDDFQYVNNKYRTRCKSCFIGYSKKYFLDKKNKLKECSKCNIIKDFTIFSKSKSTKDGYQASCKNCNFLDREKNKEKNKNYSKVYYELNKEKLIKNSSKYNTNKRNNDDFYRLKLNIFSRIKSYLKVSNITRNSDSIKRKQKERIIKYVGLENNLFRKFIEDKFDQNMNWKNYGKYWHIDHIIPLSLALTEKEAYELNSYKNLRPIEAKENIVKSNFLTKELINLTLFDNIIKNKYRMRMGTKPDQPIERDLEKANWYLNKAKKLKNGKII